MQRKMTLGDFGLHWKKKFEDFEKEQKNPSEIKAEELEDYITYKKQIDILKQKVDLIIDGSEHASHRKANVKKAEALTKEENFSIKGPITRKFAELNEQYQSDYSHVQFSTAEKLAAGTMSLFGSTTIAARQKIAAEKAAALHQQIEQYDKPSISPTNA